MKIKKLKIAWFRGSADPIELDLNLKSLVLYGENGTGKSSFVDAIEHNINNGKIKHLSHEYSGRRQEKGILNTHMPGSQNGEVSITLEDNSVIETTILRSGIFTVTPSPSPICSWDYRRTILRQNEVADFIADTKGDKYSALLPLLGLGHLEITAENLRKIERSIPIQGRYEEKRREIANAKAQLVSVFGNVTQPEIEEELKAIYLKVCKKSATTETIADLLGQSQSALQIKLNQLSAEHKLHASFLEIAELDIVSNLANIKSSAAKLLESTQPLIAEKLLVLKAALSYSAKITDEDINCPACGQPISSALFLSHIKAEETALQDAVKKFESYNTDVSILCKSLENLKRILVQDHLKDWKIQQDSDALAYIESLKIDSVRNSCTGEVQADIENKILPLIEEAKKEVVQPITDIKELLTDQKKLETIQLLLKVSVFRKEVKKIDTLVEFVASLQRVYREQIRTQSSAIIGSISSDITRMWEILHPDEKIEDVRLCLPTDIDKAIEIGLKFYGVEQDSPRLTLSEGHRNSLGLCIFLAMAKKDNNNPVILDDVVVSFDRNHRGMVGILLEKEFSDRQVILFTHERDWYIDLKRQLDSQKWDFKTLMPWESPDIGIRFSLKQYTFDDARAYLSTAPDVAGNTARKIIDTSVAVLAESLEISLPYLHRERNDLRTGHEFLEKIVSLTGSFKIKRDGTNYEPYTEAYVDIKAADRLLISWGNRSSHEFNIVKNEATALIDACEKAIDRFTCPQCNMEVTRLDDEKSGFKQCRCGFLKWKY